VGYSVANYGLGDGCSSNNYVCRGQEYEHNFCDEANDTCCPSSLWDEGTYKGVLGDGSWSFHLERLIRVAFQWMDPALLQQMASDSHAAPTVTVSPQLLTGFARAIQNFNDIYQPERWVHVPGAIPHPCSEKGFSAWTVPVAYPDPVRMNAATTRLFGQVVGAFARDDFTAQWFPIVWEGVPRRGSGVDAAGNDLGFSSYINAPSDVVTVVGATLQPTAWAKNFLDAFAPGWDKPLSVVKATKAAKVAWTKTKKINIASVVRSVAVSASAAAEKEQLKTGISTEAILLIGLGVLIVGGGGVYWYRKRRP